MAGNLDDAEELKAYRYAARCERVRKEWGLFPKQWAVLMALYAAKGATVPVLDLCAAVPYQATRVTTGGINRQIRSLATLISWIRSRSLMQIEAIDRRRGRWSPHEKFAFGYRLTDESVRRLAEALGDDGR